MAEWEARKAHLQEAATFLMESSDPQTRRLLEEELRSVDLRWADLASTSTLVSQRFCRKAGVAGVGSRWL